VELGIARIDDRLRVLVSDQGPGMPEAFKTRAFENFSQTDASDAREKGGTGLGLSTSRAIDEAYGGAIGFDSAPGQGARFLLRPREHRRAGARCGAPDGR
jgi:signal transduction histidine kinase